jgi:hypothetical protein
MKKLRSFAALAFVAAPALGIAAAPNLVPNGDFEAGNNAFSSSYSYSPGGNGTEGQYTVRSNPYPWNGSFVSIGDHTTGAGQMFVGNGSPTDGAIVWSSSPIAISSNTTYFFEAFVANVCCTASYSGANSPAELEFSIATLAVTSLGTVLTSLANPGAWQGIGKSWFSGATTTVTLSLVNRNTARGGNDFALDDVYFGTETSLPPVPEPQTYALMALGLLALGLAKRRRAPAR